MSHCVSDFCLCKHPRRAVAGNGGGLSGDTGPGISKDFLLKIFELFASQSTSQGGIGVGLALYGLPIY